MSQKKNLLFVVHRVPYPPDRGDRIRSYHLLRFLAARTNVYLATLADESVSQETLSELNKLSTELHIENLGKSRYLRGSLSLLTGRSATEGIFYSANLQRKISHWCQQVKFDFALGFCSSVAPYLDIPELRNVPRYMDFVDVDSEKFFEYSEVKQGLKSRLYGLEAQRLRNLELQVANNYRACFLVTEPEANLFREFAPEATVRAATNGIDLDYFSTATRDHIGTETDPNHPTCLFVGALDYPPNIQGIQWFCDKVWPKVKSDFPNAQLKIVGRKPTTEVLQLRQLNSVQVAANVPDVRPYYKQATVAIAPLRIARGIQNKVLEAFATKTPVIGTSNALEGIKLNGSSAIIADTVEDWQSALAELFQSPHRREQIADSGFRFVEKNHSWDHCLQPVADSLNI